MLHLAWIFAKYCMKKKRKRYKNCSMWYFWNSWNRSNVVLASLLFVCSKDKSSYSGYFPKRLIPQPPDQIETISANNWKLYQNPPKKKKNNTKQFFVPLLLSSKLYLKKNVASYYVFRMVFVDSIFSLSSLARLPECITCL